MVFPKRQMDGRSTSRSPSPSDSIESVLSSSSTLISSPDSSSAPPSPSSAVPAPSSMYSSLGTRPRRPTPPSRLLGAIDEDSSTVQPDLPLSSDNEKNPVAKLHVYAAVVNSKQRPTLALSTSPPANDFDRVMGPRVDVERNFCSEGYMDKSNTTQCDAVILTLSSRDRAWLSNPADRAYFDKRSFQIGRYRCYLAVGRFLVDFET
ncbi:hypothetical protein FOPE_05181 [Fonsecaea pedrosoi]|nr:hypothetical protein FOPE_05181 [Fonsecaea pedrosoi]